MLVIELINLLTDLPDSEKTKPAMIEGRDHHKYVTGIRHEGLTFVVITGEEP